MHVVFAHNSIVYLDKNPQDGSVLVESLDELRQFFDDYKKEIAEPLENAKFKKGEVNPIITGGNIDLPISNDPVAKEALEEVRQLIDDFKAQNSATSE